jgi:serine/threonine-protein kinase
LVAALAMAVALGALLSHDAPAPQPLRRLALVPPAGLELATDYAPPFAISRDGRSVVLRAGRPPEPPRLWLRRLDEPASRELSGTEGAWQPFFSPDGRSVGFFAERKLKLVPVDGGGVRDLVEIGGNPRGASWSERGVIVVAPSQTSGLLKVDVRTGAVSELTRIDTAAQERSHRWPHLLPGGELALFTVQSEGASFDDARIEAVRLDDGARHVVAQGGSYPVWSPSGHLLYARQGRIYAARLDPATATRQAAPVTLVDGVGYSPRNGGAQFGVADDGTLV